VFGTHAGIHSHILDDRLQFVDAHLGQLLACDNAILPIGLPRDSQLARDTQGRQRVIPGDHHRADSRLATFDNRVLDFGAWRIDHAGQTYEDQRLLQRLLIDRLGQILQWAHGHAQDSYALARQLVVSLCHTLSPVVVHRYRLPVLPHGTTQCQQPIHRAFAESHIRRLRKIAEQATGQFLITLLLSGPNVYGGHPFAL